MARAVNDPELWSLVTGEPLSDGGAAVALDSYALSKNPATTYVGVLKYMYDNFSEPTKNLAPKGVIGLPIPSRTDAFAILVPPLYAPFWEAYMSKALLKTPELEIFWTGLKPAYQVATVPSTFNIIPIISSSNNKATIFDSLWRQQFFKNFVNEKDSGYFYGVIAPRNGEDEDQQIVSNYLLTVALELAKAMKRPDNTQELLSNSSPGNLVFPTIYAKRMVKSLDYPLKLKQSSKKVSFSPKTAFDFPVNRYDYMATPSPIFTVPEGSAPGIGFLRVSDFKKQVDCTGTLGDLKKMAISKAVPFTDSSTKGDICTALRSALLSRENGSKMQNK